MDKFDTRDEALTRAIDAAGGTAALARFICENSGSSITSQAISQWRRCPVERTPIVERACRGVVTRYDLRPDIFGEAPAQPRTEAAA